MRAGRFFKIALTMIVSLFTLFLSVIFMTTPWNRHLRKWFVKSLIESKMAMFSLGLVFLAFTLLLIFTIVRLSRRRELVIPTKGGRVVLNQKVFEDYLQQYWQRLFPNHVVDQKVVMKKDHVKIIVDFPPVPKGDEQKILDKVHDDLGDLFQKIVGYEGEFELTYSFRNT